MPPGPSLLSASFLLLALIHIAATADAKSGKKSTEAQYAAIARRNRLKKRRYSMLPSEGPVTGSTMARAAFDSGAIGRDNVIAQPDQPFTVGGTFYYWSEEALCTVKDDHNETVNICDGEDVCSHTLDDIEDPKFGNVTLAGGSKPSSLFWRCHRAGTHCSDWACDEDGFPHFELITLIVFGLVVFSYCGFKCSQCFRECMQQKERDHDFERMDSNSSDSPFSGPKAPLIQE